MQKSKLRFLRGIPPARWDAPAGPRKLKFETREQQRPIDFSANGALLFQILRLSAIFRMAVLSTLQTLRS